MTIESFAESGVIAAELVPSDAGTAYVLWETI